MGAADVGGAGFREAEEADLAFPHQLTDRAGDILDRHVRIDAVLVEEVDTVGLQALERGLGDLPNVFRATIDARLRIAVLEAEPRRDHHPITERGEGFADELLVSERAVGFRRIKKGDAALVGRPDEGDRLLRFGRWAVGEAQPHAAQPDGRDFQVAVTEFALLHSASLLRCSPNPLRAGNVTDAAVARSISFRMGLRRAANVLPGT